MKWCNFHELYRKVPQFHFNYYFMYEKNVPCHVEHLSFVVQNKHFGSLCFPNRTGRWYLERFAHFEFYTIQPGLHFF